jgi:hypothetical protein
MSRVLASCLFYLLLGRGWMLAQNNGILPQVVTKAEGGTQIATIEVAARFVTTIRLPEAVNSVVVGDPAAFQAEHTEREPRLVFVKAISTKPAQTNLLISTIGGREVSILLVNRGDDARGQSARVDFLLNYEPGRSFLIAPSVLPSVLIGETVSVAQPAETSANIADKVAGPRANENRETEIAPSRPADRPPDDVSKADLSRLLEAQEKAPLPPLYSGRVGEETNGRDRVRAGVSRVIDGGEQVVVLFSAVNPTKQAILLLPPQVQLSGRTTSGKLLHHKTSSTAEQLAVLDYRLSPRRIGPGQRANGVVVFERPPYKLSNETLLLQLAESGAVDRPALAPIGFGVSTSPEDQNDRGKSE